MPSEEIRRLGSYVYTMAAVHDILTEVRRNQPQIRT